MSGHRYILEPYKGMNTRYHCPACNHSDKTFSRYIDTRTGEYLADHVGRCNRENNCGYHYTPKQYFQKMGNYFDSTSYIGKSQKHFSRCFHYGNTSNLIPQRVSPNVSMFPCARDKETGNINQGRPSFIDPDIFSSSLTGYDRNSFTSYLTGLFGGQVTKGLIERYKIGTSKHWPGATIFWQIDILGNIRAGKIMLYEQTGHRVKEPFNHITWVHKILEIDNYGLKQCFFGEHLLKGNNLPVAIVESEKTAIIASVYQPRFIWLACGQLNGLSFEKCGVLSGRTALLFPDVKGFDKWQTKAEEQQRRLPNVRFAVSDLLERKAKPEEREQGLDLADYLIRFDISKFHPADHPPQWFINMQGILRRYEAREITGDQYLRAEWENWERSGLTMPEYMKAVKYYSLNSTHQYPAKP